MISPSRQQLIEDIETHSLAAIPALETEIYDGWHIRFANGHTRRANSVNVMTEGDLSLFEKIEYAEAVYANRRLECHFRITPLAGADLDEKLASQGYGAFDPTDVRITDLTLMNLSSVDPDVEIQDRKYDYWMNALAELTGQSALREKTFGAMLDIITLDTAYASIEIDGRIIACGLAVMSEDYVGLFEFVTDPDYQRQGLAVKIANALLATARNKGAKTAYLQVVQSNAAAIAFWNEIGFTDKLYDYHYRTKS